MVTSSQTRPRPDAARAARLVAALGLLAMWGQFAEASSVAGGPGHGAGESASAHSCPCGMGCSKAACCCAGRRAAPAPRPEPAAAPRRFVAVGETGPSGPCLGSAPCGEPGRTSESPAWRVDRMSYAGPAAALFAPPAGGRPGERGTPEAPAVAPAAPDEPPERRIASR